MKSLAIIGLAFITSSTTLFAQKNKVQSAWRALSDYEETLKDAKPNLAYLNKAKEYQQKGPSMTQNQQSEYQQALGKLQNDYSETEQSLGQEMQAESAEKLQAVKMAIQDFLKTYCAAKGFAFVFASNESDYLYYKDTVRDITPDVVKGLNEAYQKTKIK